MITNTPACLDLFNVDPASPNSDAGRDVAHRATAAKLLYRAKHHRHDILLLDTSLYTNISSPTTTTTATLFVAGDAAAHRKHVASMDIGGAYLNAPMAPTGITIHMVIEPRLASVLADLQPYYNNYLRSNGSLVVVPVKASYGTVEAARLRHDLIINHLIIDVFTANRYIPATDIIIDPGTDPRPRAWIDASSGIHEINGKSHINAPIAFGKGGPLDATSINRAIVTKSDLITFPDVSSEVINPLTFTIDQLYSNVPAIVHQGTNPTMFLVLAIGGSCSKRSRHIDIRPIWTPALTHGTWGSITVERCFNDVMLAILTTSAGG